MGRESSNLAQPYFLSLKDPACNSIDRVAAMQHAPLHNSFTASIMQPPCNLETESVANAPSICWSAFSTRDLRAASAVTAVDVGGLEGVTCDV
jgi:hypothetical protein